MEKHMMFLISLFLSTLLPSYILLNSYLNKLTTINATSIEEKINCLVKES
jgi:hypothetical protein